MTGFHDVVFPERVAFGARGGPERRTTVVTLASGHEERNALWAHSRRRWDAGYGVKSLADLDRVAAFFEARLGRLYAFRFRDPFDHASAPPGQAVAATDQNLGMGDGETAVFPLVKRYGDAAASYVRPIEKPVADSVTAAVDGASAEVTVDADTGHLTFLEPPTPGAIVTAGFHFHTPARFDSDLLSIDLEGFAAGRIPSIPLLEVRL